MVLDDPSCYQDVCPLMGGCMPSVYGSSKGIVIVMLLRCKVAIVIQLYINQSINP